MHPRHHHIHTYLNLFRKKELITNQLEAEIVCFFKRTGYCENLLKNVL